MIKNIKLHFAFITLLIIMTGCIPIPKDICQIDKSILDYRSVQTRLFYTDNEAELLSSGISVLQDLGFHIDETEINLGMAKGSKTTNATDNVQIGLAVAAIILTGQQVAVDDHQELSVSLIKYQDRNNSRFNGLF
jgi:hypothetical protein